MIAALIIPSLFITHATDDRYRPSLPSSNKKSDEPPKKRGYCWICGRKKNTSASMKCDTCNHFTCKEHSKKQVICLKCAEDEVEDGEED